MVLKFIRPAGAIYIGVSKMNRGYLEDRKNVSGITISFVCSFEIMELA